MKDKREKKQKKKREKLFADNPFLRGLFLLSCILIAVVVVIMVLVGSVLLTPLPDITNAEIIRQSSQPSKIYAADGSLLATWHMDEERTPLERNQIPSLMFDATVAVEDQRFMQHSGLDLRAILRAITRNTQAGEIQEGASTITQQLMKMMYTGRAQTYARKVNEAIMAQRVEMEYDKYDILTAYLNMAYFGQGAYGLSAASQTFFGVEPKDLSIAQAATLAGTLHAPSSYNPYENPDPLQQRRDVVLGLMVDQGHLTEDTYEQVKATPLVLNPRSSRNVGARYPYFLDYVQRELSRLIGSERQAEGGMNVYTTIDPAMQQAAENAADLFNKQKDEEAPTVSMITMRHSDGAILALVGGKNWRENQFNLAVQARRQPGSAFKPVTLIAALESGISPEQKFAATPFEVPVKDEIWKVTNYDGRAPSDSMTLRAATISSVNTVYARLIMEVGPEKVVQVAHDLGFESEMEPDPALSLGGMKYGVSPLEMARAFTAMARQGELIQPCCIVAVTDALDESEILYEMPQEPELTRVYSADVGRQVSEILHEVVAKGTGRNAQLPSGAAVSGKTGTSQAYRDAWFVGWAEGLTTAVWMGHPEAQTSMAPIQGRNVTGGTFPAEIWRTFMTEAGK